jgi:uncharacterized RDD family membrane protein YckC
MKILRFLLFNAFADKYRNYKLFHKLVSNKRIKAMSLEMIYVLSVLFPYLAIIIISSEIFLNQSSLYHISSIVVFNLILIILVNKDYFNGQSVIKRQLGYQIVNAKTLEIASSTRCMLRNFTFIFWPIEVLFAIIYPSRRLGDYIAGTKLIDVPTKDPKSILEEINTSRFDKQAKLTLFYTILGILIYFILFESEKGILH